jgi:3D (Asp-Asp-Asp) domain-containing protein
MKNLKIRLKSIYIKLFPLLYFFLEKKTLISLMMAGVITSGSLMDIVITKINKELNNSYNQAELSLPIIQQNSLIAVSNPSPKPIRKIKMIVTAYSSTPEETDNTPFITASGSKVRDGIVANNLLPFGSKIRIPEVFGDKIFEVEDRMHFRKSNYQLDVWFSNKEEAKEFGAKIATIEIIES